MEGQTNDEELLRKEINHITRLFRQLKSEGTKLDKTYVQQIAVMAKSVDQWGKALVLAKASVENEKSMAQRWSDRSGADMKALKLRKLMNTESQTSRKLLQQQKSDDVERHIKMRDVMGKSSDSFNFFTKSLTKGLGFGEAIGMATEKLRSMSKVAMEQMKLEEMQKKYDEEAAKSGAGFETSEEGLAAKAAIDKQKKDVLKVGGDADGKGMGKMQKSLGKMGKFASKHAGGMLLGAGAGGLILGVIIKALSVAPMFQAMMKLMKFAVTMILMPIGTFFGAILRPIMIGLIKNIAPQFKDWMKTANDMGTKLGEYIMGDAGKDTIFTMFAQGMLPVLTKLFPKWTGWKEWGGAVTEAATETWDAVVAFGEWHDEWFQVKIPNFIDGIGKGIMDGLTGIATFFTETLPNGINFVADNVWLGLLAVETFFTETIPNGINTIADGIWTGLEQVGKLLLTPFLMFIGTINSIFMIQLPELFTGFWTFISESFESLKNALTDWLTPILEFFGIKKPEKDMEKADKSTKEVATIAESISNWWDDIMGNTEESKVDSKVASNAMESITKIFDGTAKWINNALRKVSGQTYTTSDGDVRPTDNAKIAMGVPQIPSINTSGGSSWIKYAANGFSGMVNSPTMFMAGEAGSEHVNISPHGNKSSGVPVVNINIARIDKNADFEQLKPAIQRWILEANSRRGMI
jgi:hypothetical protein